MNTPIRRNEKTKEKRERKREREGGKDGEKNVTLVATAHCTLHRLQSIFDALIASVRIKRNAQLHYIQRTFSTLLCDCVTAHGTGTSARARTCTRMRVSVRKLSCVRTFSRILRAPFSTDYAVDVSPPSSRILVCGPCDAAAFDNCDVVCGCVEAAARNGTCRWSNISRCHALQCSRC